MKKLRMFLVLFVACLVAFSCGQPQPPAGAPTATPAPVPVIEEAVDPAQDDPGEVEAEGEAPAESVAEETPGPVVEVVAEAVADEAPAVEAVEAPAGEPAVEGGTPKLVVSEPTFDFGSRRDSETVTHHFVLRNEGDGMLEIKNVRASCGCTTTDLEKNSLAPGEQVKIGAVTNLRGRQGPQTKMVTVTTNDPEQPTVQLRMTGEVVASIHVEPARVNFGRVLDDEPREETVNISSTVDDLSFVVQSAELTGMDFITHEIKEVEEGKSYDVIVRTEGQVPPGNHNGRMIIRTDSRDRSVIWLNISLQVVGALEIMPPVINIRENPDPEHLEQQQLRITSGRVEEFEISEVIVPIEGIEATLNPTGANVYLLRLANIPATEIIEDKSVVLRTNVEGYEEIEIPFNLIKIRRPPAERAATMQLTPEQRQRMRQPIQPASPATGNDDNEDDGDDDSPAEPE